MWIFFIFIFFPFVEISLFVLAAQAWGWMNMLFYLVLSFLIGKRLMQVGGQMQDLNFLAQGAESLNELPKKIVYLLAGLLLILPGLLSDALALILLFPPTRYVLLWLFLRKLGLSKQLNKVFVFKTMGGGAFSGYNQYGNKRTQEGSSFYTNLDGNSLATEGKPKAAKDEIIDIKVETKS